MRADFRILDHGSIVLIEPLSGAGREWIDENIAEEGHWAGCIAAERRYVQGIIDGIVSDGLAILGINDAASNDLAECEAIWQRS